MYITMVHVLIILLIAFLAESANDNTSNIATIVVTTILVTSFVLLSITCGITGFMMIASKFRSSKHEVAAREDVPSDGPSNIPVQLYESVFPVEFEEQDLELKENTAYGSLPKLNVTLCQGTANEPVYSSIT